MLFVCLPFRCQTADEDAPQISAIHLTDKPMAYMMSAMRFCKVFMWNKHAKYYAGASARRAMRVKTASLREGIEAWMQFVRSHAATTALILSVSVVRQFLRTISTAH